MIQIKPYKSSEALNKVPKCPSRIPKGPLMELSNRQLATSAILLHINLPINRYRHLLVHQRNLH